MQAAEADIAIRRADAVEPYVTRDGSSVREIAGPPSRTAGNLSLAEATLDPGAETIEHYHRATEEIYHFVAGAGRLRVDGSEVTVRAGDSVTIAPGSRHKLLNGGPEPLVLLCICSPPYSHEDTFLCE